MHAETTANNTKTHQMLRLKGRVGEKIMVDNKDKNEGMNEKKGYPTATELLVHTRLCG